MLIWSWKVRPGKSLDVRYDPHFDSALSQIVWHNIFQIQAFSGLQTDLNGIFLFIKGQKKGHMTLPLPTPCVIWRQCRDPPRVSPIIYYLNSWDMTCLLFVYYQMSPIFWITITYIDNFDRHRVSSSWRRVESSWFPTKESETSLSMENRFVTFIFSQVQC